MSLADEAFIAAVQWSVPVVLATATGWFVVKRKAIRAAREARQQRAATLAELPEQLRSLQASMRAIECQVHPNGGGSLRDAVSRIEGAVASHGQAIEDMRASVHGIDAMVRSHADLATDGSFECDGAGSIKWVNATFARILGVGRMDIEDTRWKNFIHYEDRAAFLAQLAAALREHRPFSAPTRMVRSDGDTVEVDFTVIPYPHRPPAKRWYGKVRLLA
ncbi:MAG: PAS domain-containing protein [Gammaproteobacteria bacterium]|nr:PAS domain-containing protein [Gammaproteobacteria bacterium]